jgi:hypothetical protein
VRQVSNAIGQGHEGRQPGRPATARRARWLRRFAAAALLAATASAGVAAHGDLPPGLLPPAGFVPFLRTYAVGTQNYVCVAPGTAAPWKFTGPQATLYVPFFGTRQQIATHFLSANPDEGGTYRATWQHSFDTSRVWARAIATVTDPAVVAPGAVAWLLLEVSGDERGPGGAWLTPAKYVQRLHTRGGVAPATGCAQPADLGAQALVPYTTDYVFFRAAR